MVCLQPRGLVRQKRVGRGVRLVESVPRELLHQVEDVRGLTPVHTPAGCAVHEHAPVLGHLGGLLLAHRAAQQIGPAQGVTGEHLGDLHHLLLVEDDPVGRLENRLQGRMEILDFGLPMLAGDEVVDHSGLQRAGSEQGDESDDVVEAVGLQAPDEVLHPARFELEHGGGRTASDELVGGRVIGGKRLEIERFPLRPRPVVR